jgi:hypothetical protein
MQLVGLDAISSASPGRGDITLRPDIGHAERLAPEAARGMSDPRPFAAGGFLQLISEHSNGSFVFGF